MTNYPEKKRSKRVEIHEPDHVAKKGEPQQAPLDVGAHPGIFNGVPVVLINIGQVGVRLALEDALRFAAVVMQSAGISYADMMLQQYAMLRMGMTQIQAMQFQSSVAQYRKAVEEAANDPQVQVADQGPEPTPGRAN